MAESTSPFQFRLTPKNALFIFGANTIIAVFLFAIRFGNGFTGNFIYSQCIGFSISFGLHLFIRRIKSANVAVQLTLIAVLMIIGTVLGIASATFLVSFLGPAFVDKPTQLMTTHEKLTVTLQSLLFSILFGSIMTYIFISSERIAGERIKRLEVETNAAVTEIKLLQSQMEPHFLFNTLSTILGLIDAQPETAKRMLESFTSFLRSSLLTARNETITFAQEMDVVKNYLEIFSVRMGGRLRCRFDIQNGLSDIRIPPLLIQPLVENAVKHGLEPSVRGGELLIRAERESDRVRIVVADTGMGISEMSSGNGIGLENARKRLELVYHGRARLVLEENQPSGVKAVIDIPYETDTGSHS